MVDVSEEGILSLFFFFFLFLPRYINKESKRERGMGKRRPF